MRHAICYISNIKEDMTLDKIEELLNFSLNRNLAMDIKGVLLYSEGNFFQILEGEKKVVQTVFQKIKKDTRHYGMIQVIGRDIKQGSYDGYKVDILNDSKKYQIDLPEEYVETLIGIDPELREALKRMLENFIVTR